MTRYRAASAADKMDGNLSDFHSSAVPGSSFDVSGAADFGPAARPSAPAGGAASAREINVVRRYSERNGMELSFKNSLDFRYLLTVLFNLLPDSVAKTKPIREPQQPKAKFLRVQRRLSR